MVGIELSTPGITTRHGDEALEWTIQDFGALGEIVGALGVVATLAYLALQIRQNTLAMRSAAVNATITALREPRQSIFESEEMTSIFAAGNSNPNALDEMSQLRYRLVMQNIVDAMLEIYSQTLSTNFSPETWFTQGVTLVERILSTNGGRWFWQNYANTYPSSFRAEVDRVLQSLEAASPPQE